MSSPIKNVIIVGAGGNLGAALLPVLDEDPQFTVSVLSRASSKSKFASHIKVIVGDDGYPEHQLVDAFKGQDAVVSAIAPGNETTQKSFVDAAVKAGVKRFLPGEFGSDASNPGTLELLPTFRSKTEVVQHLKSQEQTGLSWSGILNGPFFDWGLRNGFLGFDLESQKAVIFDSGHSRWSTTTLPTIAIAVARTLHMPKETANRYIPIHSFTTTQNEVLAALEKVSGKKWEVTHSTVAEAKKIGGEKMSKGDFGGFVDLIRAAIYDESKGSNFEKDQELANDLLGLPKEHLYETVEKIIKG